MRGEQRPQAEGEQVGTQTQGDAVPTRGSGCQTLQRAQRGGRGGPAGSAMSATVICRRATTPRRDVQGTQGCGGPQCVPSCRSASRIESAPSAVEGRSASAHCTPPSTLVQSLLQCRTPSLYCLLLLTCTPSRLSLGAAAGRKLCLQRQRCCWAWACAGCAGSRCIACTSFPGCMVAGATRPAGGRRGCGLELGHSGIPRG